MAKGKWISKRQRSDLLDSLKEHAGKLIDRVSVSDSLELISVTGVAYILASAPDFIEQVKKNKYEVFGPIAIFIPMATVGPLLDLPAKTVGIKGKVDTWQEWLVIVAISYLIVHNFGMLIQTTGNIATSISKLGLALLPTLAAGV